MANCRICGLPMTEEDGPLLNCGGDCCRCMADSGDPECEKYMNGYKKALSDAAEVFDKRGLLGVSLFALWEKRGFVSRDS